MKLELSLLLSLGYFTLSQGIFLKPATAQVVPDRTTNTIVDVSGNDFTINQGDRAGGNLFHSFGEFSVPTDGSAFFNNAADIVNIFSRVTGGNISSIDGLLGANGSANLFLLNPAGIIFGPGARLDIGGSFYGSSADSILFEDGEFSATDLDNPLLITINAPIGLNFRDDPGDIVNRSDLRVTEIIDEGTENESTSINRIGLRVNQGQNITLIGGNVSIEDSGITAPGGRVELGGLSAAGTVTLNEDGSLNFPENVERSNVILNDGATVNVVAEGGGDIVINSRNLEILEESDLLAGIIAEGGFTDSQAGDIVLNATEDIQIRQGSHIENIVDFDAIGEGGNILITAGSLSVVADGRIRDTELITDARGVGNAGSITINTRDTVSFEGFFAEASSTVFGGSVGNSGNIDIQTGSLFLIGGGQLNTNNFGQGNAGEIRIIARDSIFLDGNLSEISSEAIGEEANGADININTGSLIATDGARLSSRGFQANAGNINITAQNIVSLEGRGSNIFPGGIFTSLGSEIAPPGEVVSIAGDININAGSLFVGDGAQITSSTFQRGNAGNININAREVVQFDGESDDGFASGAFSTVETGSIGNGGEIKIEADSVFVTNGAELDASTNGIGKGGQITVIANSISLSEGSAVGSATGFNSEDIDSEQLRGGDIELNISESLSITGNSFITSGTLGKGDAGNINISGEGAAIFLGDNIPEGEENAESSGSGIIFSSSIDITPSLDSTGNAGDITITAKSLTLREGSLVNSSALSGENAGKISNSGNISIDVSERVIISGFDENTSQASQIATSLGAGVEGRAGDITITAGSLSLEDGGFLNSDTSGQGNPGNINIDVTGAVTLSNNAQIFSDVNSGAITEAGSRNNINITAGSFSITDSTSLISSSTFAQGNAGNINLEVQGDINIKDGGFLSSSTFGTGNAGNINITGNSFSLSGGANLDSSTLGQGNGGQVIINANSLSLTEGAEILTGTSGQGKAGNIIVNADDSVNISGVAPFPILEDGRAGGFSSGLIASTEEGAGGQGGEIIVNTPQLTLSDGGVITARSQSDFAGGNVTVNADTLEITGGGQIQAAAFSKGNAGNINLNINNQITIDGSDPTFQDRFNSLVTTFDEDQANFSIDPVSPESGIFANTISDSQGDGGNITIGIFDSEGNFVTTQFTEEITLSNQGTIAADSEGTGRGGTVTIRGEDINLDAGKITATTTTRQEGANPSLSAISLLVDDNLVLRNNSEISAEATNNADGGNININAGFVIGFPSKGTGSDIRANAGEGRGGNINITTQGVLGFEENSDTAGLPNDTNDIDASSEFGLDGVVTINNPDVNPLQGVDRLPTNPVSADTIAAEACSPQGGETSLIVKGKGGIPPVPTEPFMADTLIPDGKPITIDEETDLNSLLEGETEQEPENPNYIPADIKPIKTSIGDIYPARGIIKAEDGKIILTRYPTDNINTRTPHKSANCSLLSGKEQGRTSNN